MRILATAIDRDAPHLPGVVARIDPVATSANALRGATPARDLHDPGLVRGTAGTAR